MRKRGLFTGIAMSAFVLRDTDELIFYPLSPLKGYRLPQSSRESVIGRVVFEIRLYAALLLSSGLFAYFSNSNWGFALLLGCFVFASVRYVIITSSLTQGLEPVKERMKVLDSIRTALRGHSYLSLAFLIVSSSFLGFEAFRQSSGPDAAIFKILAASCGLFSVAHLGLMLWKYRIQSDH